MIRVSVFYPRGDDSTFDHDYYRETHVPMCTSAWNATAEIDKGIDGPNVAAVHLFFESMDAMQSAMASPETGKIMADVANYTNITPVLQVSEIV
ncbi:MAG: EthD family reductase [Ilumatobacteraceae bacterium]|jgi:uncharacterized protein (TIGR02118 family)